eukprot:COSAG01_NODE_2895_length_6901_cov_35.009262_12_plen_105_part_01
MPLGMTTSPRALFSEVKLVPDFRQICAGLSKILLILERLRRLLPGPKSSNIMIIIINSHKPLSGPGSADLPCKSMVHSRLGHSLRKVERAGLWIYSNMSQALADV